MTETIGQRIKRFREQNRWSQSELGRRSGVHEGYLSKLENDLYKSPGAAVCERLARTFSVSLDYLITGVDERTGQGDIILDDLLKLPTRDKEIIIGVIKLMKEKQTVNK